MTHDAPWSHNNPWSDEKIELLTLLWIYNESFSVIARETGMGRNACIGKAHRLGLRRESRYRLGAPRDPRPRASVEKGRPRKNKPHPVVEAQKPLIPDEAIPLSQRKTLVELENHHCRWPVGEPKEPGFFYCGAPEADVAGRIPYCRAHMPRAKGRPATREEREDALAAQRAYRDLNKRRLFA